MDLLLESAEWGCKGTLEELASRIDNPPGRIWIIGTMREVC